MHFKEKFCVIILTCIYSNAHSYKQNYPTTSLKFAEDLANPYIVQQLQHTSLQQHQAFPKHPLFYETLVFY